MLFRLMILLVISGFLGLKTPVAGAYIAQDERQAESGHNKPNGAKSNQAKSNQTGPNQTGSNQKQSPPIRYKDFENIDVAGVYEIKVVSGADFDVQLMGSKAALARAKVRVEDKTLYLGRMKKRGSRGKKTVYATISLPMLKQVQVSGVVEGRIKGVDTDNFEVNVSGVGDLTIEGRCGRLVATLSGVGDLNARGLKCQVVDVSVSGVGDAKVYATQSLNARVSGIGDLTCYGSPREVRKNRNFFSSIRVH